MSVYLAGHQEVLATFSTTFLFQTNLIKDIPHRNAQRLEFSLIAGSVTLTVENSQHTLSPT